MIWVLLLVHAESPNLAYNTMLEILGSGGRMSLVSWPFLQSKNIYPLEVQVDREKLEKVREWANYYKEKDPTKPSLFAWHICGSEHPSHRLFALDTRS